MGRAKRDWTLRSIARLIRKGGGNAMLRLLENAVFGGWYYIANAYLIFGACFERSVRSLLYDIRTEISFSRFSDVENWILVVAQTY